MGSYIYAVRAPIVKLELLNSANKLEVRLAKFLCRSSCADAFNGDIERAETNYTKKGIAPHIVLGDDFKDIEGSSVIEYGGEYGTFNDDHNLGVYFKPVGIILGKPRAWYLEDRLDVIEKLRRQREYRSMKADKLFIGEFGNDANRWEEYLYKEDKRIQAETADSTAMYTRGYCL